MPKSNKKYPPLKPKVISVRDFARNLSYYLTYAQTQPLLIEKYGHPQVLISPPDAEIKPKTVPKKKLSELAFFKQGYMSFTDDQTKSAVEVANELRERAWKRDYD